MPIHKTVHGHHNCQHKKYVRQHSHLSPIIRDGVRRWCQTFDKQIAPACRARIFRLRPWRQATEAKFMPADGHRSGRRNGAEANGTYTFVWLLGWPRRLRKIHRARTDAKNHETQKIPTNHYQAPLFLPPKYGFFCSLAATRKQMVSYGVQPAHPTKLAQQKNGIMRNIKLTYGYVITFIKP